MKKAIAVCHIRNDNTMLLPVKKLTKDEREKLQIANIEKILHEEVLINGD